MAVKSLDDLFVSELRDIYHAEKQLLKALPKMVRTTSDNKLQKAFEEHLEETEGQVERLEGIFDELDLAKRGKHCSAMEGLIEEAKEIMDEVKDSAVLDAALITAAQKVEHYEIASYGSLIALGKMLGNKKATKLLEQTLEQERNADKLLTDLANDRINQQAAAA